MSCKHPKPCERCKAQRKRHEAVLRKAGKSPARRRKRVPRDPEIVLGRAQYDR